MKDTKTDPDHYTLPSGLQCIDVVKHFDFRTGNAIKYLWRAGKKDGESRLDDLRKAENYIKMLISDETEEK